MTSEFVRPRDLVFDIGANRSEYTRLYIALGARVVAVEPNPELAEVIAATAPQATARCRRRRPEHRKDALVWPLGRLPRVSS